MSDPMPGALIPAAGLMPAAEDLRRAVHALAVISLASGSETAPASLARAAELVRAASAELAVAGSPPVDRGPFGRHDGDDVRHYRHRSLYQGVFHPFSPPVVWETHERPDGAPARRFGVRLSRLYQGPPGAVHGGYLSGLFDELLGGVQALAPGGGGYTAKLTVRYRALTPIEEPLTFTGWIARAHGRRVLTSATCQTEDGRCTAEAEALFVRPVGP